MTAILAAGKPNAGLGIMLGILAVIVLAVFYWAVALRKPEDFRHRRHHWRKRHHEKRSSAEGTSDDEAQEKDESNLFGKRRRRRRRKHRPTNPTLAETGGLPPKRSETEPPRGI